MFDIIALGELLIDFVPTGLTEQGHIIFEANPGGAPCNVLAMANQLGKKTAFIGKVGKDMFGVQLRETLKKVGIEDKGLIDDSEVNTTLAFVKNEENGERSFSFYRNPGADMNLKKNEIDLDLLSSCKVFHFGTLSMTHEQVREATKHAIDTAKQNKSLISFDPNLREPLWDDLNSAKEQMLYGCSMCDILKIEEKELEFLTGKTSIQEGIDILKSNSDIKIIFVTAGSEGSYVFYKDQMLYQPAFLNDKTIDTTGAGDTFYGACLAQILNFDIEEISNEHLQEILTFSNAAASILTTRKGAICSMPKVEEVLELIKIRNK
ncbi:carbohydrate kinase family protein [Anaerosacchariphilus polymeriproducens]